MAGEILTIDVLDSGTVQGDGPLDNIVSVAVTEELDKAGQITISMPATDTRAIALIASERQVNINTVSGQVGSGLIQNFNVAMRGTSPLFQLVGTDLLGELNHLNTGYNRTYDDANVANVIIGTTATSTSLLGDTTWTQGTVTIDGSVTTQTILFNAATRLAALVTLARQIGHHFRQGDTARTLDFGVFGADSGFRIVSIGSARYGLSDSTVSGYASGIALNTISGDLENKMFPLGKNKFDMRDAPAALTDILVRASQGLLGFTTTADGNSTGSTIPVTATTGFIVGEEIFIADADDWTADHESGFIASISAGVSITLTAAVINSYAAGADVLQRPQFYIEDAASIAAYGIRESCPQFSWIGPGATAGDADLQATAAESLYRACQARMTTFKDPYKSYTLQTVYNLPWDLRVGQKIRLNYRGLTSDGTLWVSEDDDFYVMKITRKWQKDAGGVLGIATVVIANVSRPMPNNRTLILYNQKTNTWIGL